MKEIVMIALILLMAGGTTTTQLAHASNDVMPDGEKLSWHWQLLPDSSHSIQWDDGYKAGYMGVYPIAEHTKDFWAGYKSGADQVGWDKTFCKDVLMRDHQSCAKITHEGRLVATTGPTVCHEESGNQVCEAGIGANTNTTSNQTR